MIAVDTNILVYAHREDSAFHQVAVRRVTELAQGPASWAIPWPCLHEFLAVVTHPRIYAPPTPLLRAFNQVEAWLGSPTVVLLCETALHWRILRELLTDSRVADHEYTTPASPPCAGRTASASFGRPTAISAALPASTW